MVDTRIFVAIGIWIGFACGYFAGDADAHRKRVYWSEVRAEQRLGANYSSAVGAECFGFKGHRGKKLRRYRHFDCYVSPEGPWFELHVVGRWKFDLIRDELRPQ